MTEHAWTRGKSGSGIERIDRCIESPRNGLAAVVEAKQRWPRLHFPAEKIARRVDEALDSAAEQLCEADGESKLERHERYDHVAVVFVAPRLSIDRRETLGDELKKLLSAVRAVRGAGAAWAFPRRARGLTSEGYLDPGVAVVGRTVRPRG